MLFRTYIVLVVIPLDRLADERRICWSLVWMSCKLIGGVPSFVVDFA